jgi:DNA-binding HxlR family transcriptional regulator
MPSTSSLAALVALSQSRWSIPVLALLGKNDGARFAEMLSTLGIARQSLVRTLEGLIAEGWVMRNPGYGHPLRPEYLLTRAGHAIVGTAVAIETTRRRLGLEPADLTRWSLPIVRSVSDGASRFNELSRALPAASPRTLSQSLKSLVGHRLLARELIDTHPPASFYRLTRSGATLALVV